MAEFIGQSGHHVLFSNAEKTNGVIVDTVVSLVVTSGDFSTLSGAKTWGDGAFSAPDEEIAETVLASLEHPEPESTGRMYTIPRGAQSNARRGLQSDENESPVAQYFGTLLAAGGQVSFNELSNIASFFENREEDDSTTWRLYGGSPAKKWATTILEREAVTASAPKAPEDLATLLAENSEVGPEFFVRLDTKTGEMDRLYRLDLDQRTYVWEASSWNDLGQTDWDIWDYDFALDGKPTDIHQTHIIIDVESALEAANLLSTGVTTFNVDDISPLETTLATHALASEDWDSVDTVMLAAGVPSDGVYTEDERSDNASKQVRDGSGQFAKMGTRVMVNGDLAQTGVISRVIPSNGTVEVTLDNGNKVVVAGSQVEQPTLNFGGPTPAPPGTPLEAPKLDLTGIVAAPRKPKVRTVATLPTSFMQMSPEDLKAIIDNYPAWAKHQRDGLKETDGAPALTKGERPKSVAGDYTHPLLNKFLNKKRGNSYPSKVPYTPLTAAGAATETTPETSEVQPVYLAIVSPDDPRAVFKLVSLVPANATSNQPMAYSREDGAWVRDEPTMNDLRSPTPPPVIALDDDSLDDVLVQVDEAQDVAKEEPVSATPIAVPVEPDPGSITASAIPDDLALMVLWGPNKNIMSQALIAAGGSDRNRGGAEKLRKYWTVGEGGAKIRWNTGGDWTRCVRYLTKHLGPRARGYCALRHKEMTGMWTGDKKHRQAFSMNTPVRVGSEDIIRTTEDMNDAGWLRAQQAYATERVLVASATGDPKYQIFEDNRQGLVAAAGVVPGLDAVGGAFFIPLVIPEELESGDGREIEKYGLDMRNLPLPLMWQIHTAEGHNGAVVVGRIEKMGRTPQGIGVAYGHFDVGPFGAEAERMVRAGMLRHISADMDKFEAETEEASDKDPRKVSKNKLNIKKARVMGVTIVAKPAFQECTIEMAPTRHLTMEDSVLPDGIIVEEPDPLDAVALVAAGYTAELIPVVPPKTWFENPGLTKATPLNIDDDGRVFGHIAAWATGHLSPQLKGVNPPRSESGYAYFHTGYVRTEEGSDVPVGQLTLAGGHADLNFNAREAVKHYDDTASAVADVHAGEDEFGIWVAGGLRPGTTPEQIRVLRASAPSGDWRPIRGKLELVAVCQVNVPGFPIARAMVASGETMALVAAGAASLAHLRPDPILELAHRVSALETMTTNDPGLAERAAAILDRMAPHRERHNAELSAKAEELTARMESFGYVSKKSRDAAAEQGYALPDGSYPIRNEADLKNAIAAYGRAKESDRSKVRKHIIKRARALGKVNLIPDNWKTAASDALTASIMSMRERVEQARLEQPEAITASVKDDIEKLTPAQRQRLANDLRAKGEEVPEDLIPKAQGADENGQPKYTPGHQPRDYNGQFRLVLARLKENLGVTGNTDVQKDIEETNSSIRAGDYAESVRAGLDLRSRLDRLDSGALNAESLTNVRSASRDLGKAISNLPLPFKNQAQKVRFSDLPPTLRDLMDDLVDRVNKKIGTAEGNKATAKLRSFMSGGDVLSQGEISKEMSRFLRLLT